MKLDLELVVHRFEVGQESSPPIQSAMFATVIGRTLALGFELPAFDRGGNAESSTSLC